MRYHGPPLVAVYLVIRSLIAYYKKRKRQSQRTLKTKYPK